MTQKPPQPLSVVVVLITGVLAVSTAAIWIRLAIASAGMRGAGFSLVLAATRLTLASLILVATQKLRGGIRSHFEPHSVAIAAAAGFFLALHFATWITSLSYTSIAASTTLVTTNPIWVVLLCWLIFGEKPTAKTMLGIGVALSGGILIGLAGTEGSLAGSQPLLGNFLALVGSWTVSIYLLLGREALRQGLSTGGYGSIAYSVAAVVLLPLPLVFGTNYGGYPSQVYLYILFMALLPQLVGHTSLNWAMRWISPTLVTLAILFEPVCASLFGYWVFGEVPAPLMFVGAIVLLVGVAIAALGQYN